jgi:hypothetical protein
MLGSRTIQYLWTLLSSLFHLHLACKLIEDSREPFAGKLTWHFFSNSQPLKKDFGTVPSTKSSKNIYNYDGIPSHFFLVQWCENSLYLVIHLFRWMNLVITPIVLSNKAFSHNGVWHTIEYELKRQYLTKLKLRLYYLLHEQYSL